jgi:hypothetical protein
MPQGSKTQNNASRVAIIDAVKTYLGFFVLVVLVVEAVLGALALKTEGQNQLVVLYGMLLVIGALIFIVSFFAYRKPDALLRAFGGRTAQDGQLLQDFCSRISGYWWERIRPDVPSAISFVEIGADPATNTVKMKGKAYGKDGMLAAMWESVASCINVSERKMFYYWKGWHPTRPNEPYEGFGEISFHESANGIDSGVGIFSDTNVTDVKSTTKKSVEFWRSVEAEVQIMQRGDDQSASEMIRKKLG